MDSSSDVRSRTAVASRECPECSASLPPDGAYVRWCAACDWNVDPGAPDPEPGRIAAARRRLAQRYGQELAGQMEGAVAARPRRDAAAVLALTLSMLVHGLTVLLVVAGALLVVLGWDSGALPVVGALLLAVAAVLRPRFGHLPQDAPLMDRDDAPRLFALIDEVAAVAGTTGVDTVVVDAGANASVTTYGLRRRRVLYLGLGLWEMLDPQERVAVLGHELGHFAHGDLRHGTVTSGALRSLHLWLYFLSPSEPEGMMDRFVNAMIFLPRCLVLGTVTVLDLLTLRAAQRAEYLADATAGRAGSTEAAVALMDRLLLCDSAEAVLRREAVAAQMRGGAAGREARALAEQNLWGRLAERMGAVPAHEYERLRRVSARRGHSVDDTHPPTHLRRRCVAAAGPHPARVVCDDERRAAIADELAPARSALARTVIHDYAG
ncbi:M48 family metallopeptidase [Streptomyces sp. NPDC002057]|uniref:M48 family metallopeptidase n=1 Tax=Streptomyces sp. NPDC002057 TaxID=3154664 RepID=UPI003318319D